MQKPNRISGVLQLTMWFLYVATWFIHTAFKMGRYRIQAGILHTIATKTYANVWSAMHDNAFKLTNMIDKDSDLREKKRQLC